MCIPHPTGSRHKPREHPHLCRTLCRALRLCCMEPSMHTKQGFLEPDKGCKNLMHVTA
jgi:hypothetical protein